MKFVGDWIQHVYLQLQKEVSFESVTSDIDGVGRVDMIVYNEETRSFQNEGYVEKEDGCYWQMDCHMGECTTIDIDRKHYNLATGSTDTFVSIIDCNEMITLNAVKCHKFLYEIQLIYRTGVRCVRWTADGKYVAVCSEDGVISILSPISGTIKCCFEISKDSYVFLDLFLKCRCLQIILRKRVLQQSVQDQRIHLQILKLCLGKYFLFVVNQEFDKSSLLYARELLHYSTGIT